MPHGDAGDESNVVGREEPRGEDKDEPHGDCEDEPREDCEDIVTDLQ